MPICPIRIINYFCISTRRKKCSRSLLWFCYVLHLVAKEMRIWQTILTLSKCISNISQFVTRYSFFLLFEVKTHLHTSSSLWIKYVLRKQEIFSWDFCSSFANNSIRMFDESKVFKEIKFETCCRKKKFEQNLVNKISVIFPSSRMEASISKEVQFKAIFRKEIEWIFVYCKQC